MKLLHRSPRWLGLAWKATALAALAMALIAGYGAGGNSASAATQVVQVGQDNGGSASQNEYNLASITITEGDTVDWQWFAGYHDVVSYASAEGTPDWTSGAPDTNLNYQRTFNTVGTYTYYCTQHANWSDADPSVVDSEIAGNNMVGKIVVEAASVDSVGPVTSGVAALPNPTNGAAGVTLTALVDDSVTGNSNIQAAEYFIDSVGAEGTGTLMTASDGSFDSDSEIVTASVDVSGLSLVNHTLYVRGQDVGDSGTWGATDSVVLDV
ncbi:MAG: hypothetical protein V3S20_01725, partial [Dehalococcoidia bacterium]